MRWNVDRLRDDSQQRDDQDGDHQQHKIRDEQKQQRDRKGKQPKKGGGKKRQKKNRGGDEQKNGRSNQQPRDVGDMQQPQSSRAGDWQQLQQQFASSSEQQWMNLGLDQEFDFMLKDEEDTVGETDFYFLCYEVPTEEKNTTGNQKTTGGWSIGRWVQVYPDPSTESISDW